ncbi:MAG: glycosyltransferase family 2 protein [Luteolibacter sp.]
MLSNSIEDLPKPPPDRHGWPWDQATPPLPPLMTDGSQWPKISIVTPSYNQGQYIEETIRSILLQGYPNLEFHIIDGGSTDNTLEIIRKYEPWVSSWVSEDDRGQSDAINKGFKRCSGQIFNWLCSDDLLAQGALQAVSALFLEKPGIDVVAGACGFQYDDEPERDCIKQVDWKDWELAPYSGVIWQPSCFFRKELIGRQDLVRTDLHYCMDRELWAYLWSINAKWEWTTDCLSVFRFTGANKSTVGGQRIISELDSVYGAYFDEAVSLPYLLRRFWLPLVVANLESRSSMVRLIVTGISRAVTMILSIWYPRVRVKTLQRDFYFCVARP